MGYTPNATTTPPRGGALYDPKLPTFKIPLAQIIYSKPDEEMSEAQKFANNGEWFMRMNRWICFNFFNQFVPSFDVNAKTPGVRWSDNMSELFAFYFGTQTNKTFRYTEAINENDTIQAVYVPDQKIRALIDPMIGSAIKMIQPMKDSISVKVLGADSLKQRAALKTKLEIKKHLRDILTGDSGVQFSPEGSDDLDQDPDADIDDIIAKIKSDDEIQLIQAAQSIFFSQRLAKKFEDSAYHEFVNNVSQFVVRVINGEAVIDFTPCYNTIADTRCNDSFLSDALLSGFVEFLSPSEIFSRWGNEMSDEEKNHINRMSQRQYSNWLEAYNYYNLGSNNVTWFCQSTGKVSCATTYWIGKKDLRYRAVSTKYGDEYIQNLEDNQEYFILDDKGRPTKEKKKGSEIKGDATNYFVHMSTNIGNYCTKGFGYFPIQIRPRGMKQKPLLPTIQYIHRLTMGHYRSLVSRLRHFSEEKGRLKLKIQELTGRDMGKVYALFADKLGLGEQESEEIFKDFKSMGFSLFNRSPDLPEEEGKLTADVLDFSLSPSISAYIELCREQDREMEMMCSTSQIALGQQQTTIGKGVQENSIAQSTLGQLSLFDGLYEHWTQVLRYATNVEKVLSAGKEKVVQTSADTAHLLKISKSMQWEDIGLYVEPNDSVEGQQQKVLNDGLFALSQNGGTLEATEALLNTMHLIRFNSAAEGIRHLEKFVDKKKKEMTAQAQQGQAAQAQQSAMEISLAHLFEEKLQASKDEAANYRAEVTATLAAQAKLHGDLQKGVTDILKVLGTMQPTTPVQQDIAAASQQQQMQQQGQQQVQQ